MLRIISQQKFLVGALLMTERFCKPKKNAKNTKSFLGKKIIIVIIQYLQQKVVVGSLVIT